MVKKVILNLDSSKVSGPDCVPVVVLKNCESEPSYILPELFIMCLKESCLPDCRKVSLVVPVFKNVGERSTAKSQLLVLFFVLKLKLVNNRTVDHQEKCGLFSDFQYGFRSSQSTADLLTVVFDRIVRTLTGLELAKLCNVIHSRLFTNLSLMEFHVRYLALFFLFSAIDGFKWFQMESIHKNIQ